jgi:hypothetical protein
MDEALKIPMDFQINFKLLCCWPNMIAIMSCTLKIEYVFAKTKEGTRTLIT